MPLTENDLNHIIFDVICRKSLINTYLKLFSKKDKLKI